MKGSRVLTGALIVLVSSMNHGRVYAQTSWDKPASEKASQAEKSADGKAWPDEKKAVITPPEKKAPAAKPAATTPARPKAPTAVVAAATPVSGETTPQPVTPVAPVPAAVPAPAPAVAPAKATAEPKPEVAAAAKPEAPAVAKPETAAPKTESPAASAPVATAAAKPAEGVVVPKTEPAPPAQIAVRAPIAPGQRPDDVPSLKVGMTFFSDFTYTASPDMKDVDGNAVNLSQFNVGRSYLNITGNVSHIVSYRLTPDISRETGTGSTLSGSLTFRVKYAFAQFGLEDWMPKGSWVRVGIQQTPWVDFEEGIYRYRFQGTVFSEREGFLSSSDAGVSFHYNLPSNYGDVHAGVYNGETYSKVETNNQKATQVRASFRPLAKSRVKALQGLRAHVFYDRDHYVIDAERTRLLATITYEHPHVNAGFQYLNAKDQASITKADIGGKGYSFWITPRASNGFEGLIRFDHLVPNTVLDTQLHQRTVLGVAYWFPHQGSVSSAILVDYDNGTFPGYVPEQVKQSRVAVHGLVAF